MNYKCPVCNKEWPQSMDVAKHIFGTSDTPHKEWVNRQFKKDGFTFDDLLIRQVITPGNHSYHMLAEVIEKNQQIILSSVN